MSGRLSSRLPPPPSAVTGLTREGGCGRHSTAARWAASLLTGIPPVDGAELRVSDEGVAETDSSDRLVGAGQTGVASVSDRMRVPQGEALQIVSAYGQGEIGSNDIFRPGGLAGEQITDVEIAHLGVDRDSVT